MATLFFEGFETDGNGTRYTTSVPEFSDGSGDFFTRTDGSNISSSYQVLNPDGSFYFAAQDINGEGAASQQTLTFSGIDITGSSNLNFSTLLAEDDDGSNQDWDASDFVLFEYQIDGGGFNNLLAIENDGSTFNSAPLQDTDFDGTGDGTEVTSTFASFSSAIAQTGSTLDLRITMDLDSGDEDIAVDSIQITGDNGSSDTPPTVSSTTPADNETGIAANANIDITFSEDVNFAANSFSISDSGNNPITATFSGSGNTYTLDPDSDLADGETITVTLNAANITDTDGTADELDGDRDGSAEGSPTDDFTFDFTVASAPSTPTLISTIQGNGTTSPLTGQTVTIEGVVVGDFQVAGATNFLRGFYIQEEDADKDADANTSEGIFVYDNNFGVDVNEGDLVRVSGEVAEFNNLTELTNVTDVTIQSSGNTLPTATTVNFPVNDVADLEAYEGMLVTIPDTLWVTEFFNLDRFGQVLLSSDDATTNQPGTDGRLDQYTQFNAPDNSGFATYQAEIAKRQIFLDDGQTVQNPEPIIHGRGGNPLTASNTLRGGDTVSGLTGILDERFSDYRIQPVDPVNFTAVNNRPATVPDVGGSLKVASFNVLNYFNGNGFVADDADAGKVGTFPSPRGADDLNEFQRQQDKIVNAIVEMDSDIIGLVEIENDGKNTPGTGFDQNSAIQNLVDELNDQVGANTYDFVNPGTDTLGSDDIMVALVYNKNTVSETGTAATVADGFNQGAFDDNNRKPLAQTFQETSSGEEFTVVVNHFKSKGSSAGGTGDNDAGDGQGNSNGTRTRASEDLVSWLATNPTGTTDSDYLIIGDINAYAKEDPITTLETAGYKNLLDDTSYSYVFDGQWGSLDHSLANSSLQPQFTGAAKWHINADEPDALDYNTNFRSVTQQNDLYADDFYRSSDHDPVLVGLNLGAVNIGETGTISNLTDISQTITLDRTYTNPVIFAQPLSFNGSAPAAVRLDNLTSNSFTISVQEPNNEDGTHTTENLSYMVLEAGNWELADGSKLQVGSIDSNLLVDQGWESINFNAGFDSNPVVMSQVQTFNGADFVRTRQRNIGVNGFQMAMEEEEANALSGHVNETIGYMAMSGGSGNWSGLNYTAGYTGDNVTDAWKTVNFGAGFSQTPQVLASLATYDGTDSAGLRYQNLDNNQVQIKVEEDTSLDAETTHTTENVSFLAIEGSGLLSASPVNPAVAMLETGSISNLTDTPQTITFNRNYSNPVVIAQPLSFNGTAPAAVRLDNITNNSFTVSVQEPNYEDGIHVAENLSYIVAEAGSWELADGTKVQVGSIDSDQLVTQGFENVNFNAGFANTPVVMSQVQTFNGTDFVRTRQRNIDANSFQVGMEEEEANQNSGHVNEKIGYFAIESGSGNLNGVNYTAGYTGDNVTDAWGTVNFGAGFSQTPQLLASLASYDGTDPAGLRYQNLDNNQVEIKVEEDTSFDAETTHTTENVGFFAIEGSAIVSAVNIDGIAPVLAGVQTLNATSAADTFILGDATESYYDNMGIQDYALILNFESSEDVIQLHGNASDYQLGAAPSEVPQGTGIFLNNNELVGVVSEVSDLALDADYFSFV